MKELGYIKAIGHSISQQYSINWDEWTEEETKRLERQVTIGMRLYERLFREMCRLEHEVDDEMFEEIMENLISGYVLRNILDRKKAVEDLLSAP